MPRKTAAHVRSWMGLDNSDALDRFAHLWQHRCISRAQDIHAPDNLSLGQRIVFDFMPLGLYLFIICAIRVVVELLRNLYILPSWRIRIDFVSCVSFRCRPICYHCCFCRLWKQLPS